MADIADELNAISTSIYGREMRGAIHDAIKKVNDDVEDIRTEFAQMNQAVTDIREDNEKISNELAQLENAFIVDEERDASNSWSGKKYVFSNGVLMQGNDEDYECKIYYGLNIVNNIWVFDAYCTDVNVPVAILCPNGGGDLLENCVPIYAEEVGAINKTISITKESTGYPSDACIIILNSYQNEPTLYKHGLNVYTKSETDAAIANAITNVINTAY